MDCEKTFLIDGGSQISYGKLLDFVSNSECFYPSLKTSKLTDFILNFILAIANGKDVCLLDSDLSEAEISTLGVNNVNCKVHLKPQKFSTISGLLHSIESSNSKIAIFTSGTSGDVKKIQHTAANLVKFTRRNSLYEKHVWGFAYNAAHIAGVQVLLQALFNTNKMVNFFGKDADEICRLIDENLISHISATPTFYRLLLANKSEHLSVLRLTCGGEKSGTALHKRLLKIFPNAKINNIYASTEFGALLASNGEFFKIPESLAKLVLIKDGELLVHKSLLGAFENLKLENDFYKTGDIVEFLQDNSGLFRFQTRAGDIVNVGGYKVNLEEVEDVLREYKGVLDARVYGRKNSVLGNILCADIKFENANKAEISDIRSFLSKKLQAFKIPRKINFTDEIKSSRNGKLKR